MDIINGKINAKMIKWKIIKSYQFKLLILILIEIYHIDGISINNSII